MTGQERNQIQETIRKSPRTIWGYWPFVFPILLVILGAAIQIALLRYFMKQVPGLEICIRHGARVETLWDSQLVKEAVLTVSFSITLTFALLAFLAHQAFKQVSLLRAAAKDLGMDEVQQNRPKNKNQPIRPG